MHDDRSEIINNEMWQFISSPMQHAVLGSELSRLAKNVYHGMPFKHIETYCYKSHGSDSPVAN